MGSLMRTSESLSGRTTAVEKVKLSRFTIHGTNQNIKLDWILDNHGLFAPLS